MNLHLHVHLVFSGDCFEAFSTYKELFEGEIVFLFRKEEDKISHIILKTEHFSLQGEDTDAGGIATTGSSKLVLEFWDLAKLQRIFNALSKGGIIVSPLEKSFFSEAIGEVIDRFGVRWLIMMTDENYQG